MTEAWPTGTVMENQLGRAGRHSGRWTGPTLRKSSGSADLFLLCNPHNPLGIVWTEEELRRMMELCLKHHVLVVCDEIHSDLIFHGKRHIPTASLSPEIAANVVTGISGTKTFNLAGLQASTVVFPNAHMKARSLTNSGPTWISTATTPSPSPPWRRPSTKARNGWSSCLPYLSANFDFVVDYCETAHPQDQDLRPRCHLPHVAGLPGSGPEQRSAS